METTIRQFQEEVRDILNKDTWFEDHGIDWLAEDTLDIEYEIKKHLGQTGMVAVVTTPELTYQGEAASTTSRKNYEETEIPAECVIVGPAATVTLLNDPRNEMRDGGELRFSDWYGQPSVFKWVPNNGFFWNAPTVEGTGEPYATITPPTDPTGTVWQASIFNGSSYSPTTISIPQSSEFKNGWKTHDEQGREITVLTSGENQVTVSGGCFAEHSMTVPIGTETTEIVGDKTYKATVTFNGDIPQTVAMSMTKDNLSGKPFDKKLTWFEAQGNAFFNTSVVPDINDFIALDFSSLAARPTSKNIAALCGTVNARVSNNQLGMFQTKGSGIYNARGSYSITPTVGVFIDKDGKNASWANTSGKSGAFSGLQSQTTAATGSRAWRFGVMTKEPDTWNAAQSTAGGNNNPTYTNTTTPLAIFGVYNGDESNGCYNWWGKLYFFKLWDRLRTTKKLDLYPVIKDGNVCLYDAVTNTVLQNGYTGDTSTITWEEDADFNEIINDNSAVDFMETVYVVNPTVNRGKPNKDAIATAIDVAHHAVYTLAGYDSNNFNNFNPSTIRQSTVGSAGNKLLQVDARFTSTPIL